MRARAAARLREVPPLLQDLVLVAVVGMLQLGLVFAAGDGGGTAVLALVEPLPLLPGWTWSSAGVELAAIVALAPFLRNLLGARCTSTRRAACSRSASCTPPTARPGSSAPSTAAASSSPRSRC